MNAKLNLLIAGLLIAVLPELNRASAQTIEYAVIDLGTLWRGDASNASGINDRGEVVGRSDTFNWLLDSLVNHAFLYYPNGFMLDLRTLGGVVSAAYGINDKGQIVGSSEVAGGGYSHAFLYSGGVMRDLGTLGGLIGGLMSLATDINDNGQVVGGSEFSSSIHRYHAFLFSEGVMRDLGTLGALASIAYGINESGQVVGRLTRSDSYDRAFLYENGAMRDLGTFGGNSGSANAINDLGHVVGRASTSEERTRAFLYSNGSMKDLGTLGGISDATDINNYGEIVGSSELQPNSWNWRAFLYSNGALRDLNKLIDQTLGWKLERASAINSAGYIVGTGVNPEGKNRGFLLKPIPRSTATFGENSHLLTNAYMPFTLNSRLVYTGYGHWSGQSYSVEVLAQEEVNGVSCVKVNEKGDPVGDTFLWVAQDIEGNIWRIRLTSTFLNAPCDDRDLLMPASPAVGKTLTQRNCGTETTQVVKDLNASVATPFRDFTRCLVLRDDKIGLVVDNSYAPGVGLVKKNFSGVLNGGFHLSAMTNVPGNIPRLFVSRELVGPYESAAEAELDTGTKTFSFPRPVDTRFYRIEGETALRITDIHISGERLHIQYE